MIRPLDIENFDTAKLRKIDEKKSAPSKLSGLSSKLFLLIGFLILFFIVGSIGYNKILLLKEQPSHVLNSFDKNKAVAQIQKSGLYMGEQLLKAGMQAGAAVLGLSVKFVQKTATESAPVVASAAAKMVIQSAAPALVQQINKLPPDQKNQLKQLLCK